MGRKTDWSGFAPAGQAGEAGREGRPPRGRRRKWASAGAASIPIVNEAHEIVGWTDTAPSVENGRLRHSGAERVLRGPIFCTQIALVHAADIHRAGGPSGWSGPWRCMALCPVDRAHGLDRPLSAAPPAPSRPSSPRRND